MGANVIDTNLGTPFDVVKALSELNQQAIVRPNNPPPGIAGFLFNVTGDEWLELQSQITVNYVESNTPISDHIALEPEKFTVKGLVAELTTALAPPDQVTNPPDPLPEVPPFKPPQSGGAQQWLDDYKKKVDLASKSATSDKSLANLYSSKQPTNPNQTKQAGAVGFFYNLWKSRQLFSVETPWGIFNNMGILSLRAQQPEETKFLTDFTITFMLVRFAGEVAVQPGKVAGRTAAQTQAQQPAQNGNVGQSTTSNSDKNSILYNMFGSAVPVPSGP